MVKNNKLDQRLQQIPTEIWLKITKIDELKGQWIAGARLSPQILGRLRRSVLIASTGASTRIEGARLSDEDVEKLMRGIDIQKFSNRDKQEVQGYYELLENVFDSWKSLRLGEGVVKHFYKELLKYVRKDEIHRGDPIRRRRSHPSEERPVHEPGRLLSEADGLLGREGADDEGLRGFSVEAGVASHPLDRRRVGPRAMESRPSRRTPDTHGRPAACVLP